MTSDFGLMTSDFGLMTYLSLFKFYHLWKNVFYFGLGVLFL